MDYGQVMGLRDVISDPEPALALRALGDGLLSVIVTVAPMLAVAALAVAALAVAGWTLYKANFSKVEYDTAQSVRKAVSMSRASRSYAVTASITARSTSA